MENESYIKTHRSLYKQQHRWGWGIIVFPITLAGFLETPVSYNIPSLLGYILLGASLLNIPIVILRRKIIPIPENWPWWRHIWDFIETAAITVNMLTFGFLPHVQAQTELLLGLKPKRKLNVTEKVIINCSSRKNVAK